METKSLDDALTALAKELEASARALHKGGGRYAKADSLRAVLEFLRLAGISETSLVPLWELRSELDHDQDREENPGKRPPKAIKTTADQGHALAVIDLLMKAGSKLDEATRKVATEVPGLNLSADQLKNLRKHASRGNQRPEMQKCRHTVINLARDNRWPPEDAARLMLDLLRERCYVEKKEQ